MSEYNLLAILAARAGTRRSTMLREINHQLDRIREEGLEFDRVSKMMVFGKGKRRQSSIVPLFRPQSIDPEQQHDPSVLDRAAKIIATVKALKGKEELQDLNHEIDRGMPNINLSIEETSRLISARNIPGLNARAAEIDRNYERMLAILRAKDKELVASEISMTASHLRHAFQEIGFGSIKEISSEGGAVLLRAKNTNTHTSVVAMVNASDIRIDTHGFVGPSCSQTVAILLKKLRERGIEAKIQERVFHNRAEGGELVREVTPLFDPLEANTHNRRDREAERRRRIRLERSRQMVRG